MKSRLKRTFAFATLCLSSIGLVGIAGPGHAYTPSCSLLPARSEVVNGEVFLGGDFIELGVSQKGSFGTAGNAPAAFRGTDGAPNLGMGADLDGYCLAPSDNTDLPIDFFLPGAEEERWGVAFTLSGTQHYGSYSELNTDNGSGSVTATHSVTDESSGSNLSAKVVSVISVSGVQTLRVTATHSFAKSQAFFRTEVVFENLSGSTLTDVRYHRSFDPDNAVFQAKAIGVGDGFTTTQTILDTVAVGGTSVVQAKLSPQDLVDLAASGEILDSLQTTSGITTEIPILYYSAEPESVAYFGGFDNPNPYEPLLKYDGVSTDFFDSPQALGSGETDDRGMGIIVRTLSLASGATSSPLNFITSLDARDFSELETVLEVASQVSPSEEEPSAPPSPQLPRFDSYSIASNSESPELRFEGKRLWCINSMTLDGVEIPFTSGFSTPWYEYINADISGITPGDKTLVVQSCMGQITYTNWITITAPVEPKSMWAKLSSFGLNEATKAKIAAFNSSLGDGYTRIRCIVNSSNGDDMNEALAAQICSFAKSNDVWNATSLTQTKDSFAGTGYWINIWVSGN